MADVTKITLPDGTTKDIKDATARTQANWNTNNGVKNLAPYNNGTENSPLKIPCNFKNGESYTVSWSSITSTSTSDSSRIAFMSGDNIVSNIYYASHSVAGSATLTLTADCDSLWVYAGSIYEANKTVTISNFMVRPTSIVDSTYEPYALPNTKITPELIDLVDSGAKNVFSPTITTGVDSDTNLTLTVNSDNTITISGTAQSSKYIVIGRGYTTAGNYVLSGTPSGITVNTGGYMRIEQGGEGVSQVLTPVDITLDNREYVVYLRVLSGKTYNHTITPMLCTKAAWDVSQKFVPYRPTYEDTVEQVAKITPTTTYKTNHAFQSANYELINDVYIDVPDGKRIFLVVGAKQSNVTGVAVCFNTTTYDATKLVISQEVSAAQQMISCAGCYDNGNGGRAYRLSVFAKGVAGSQLNCRVTLSWWYL